MPVPDLSHRPLGDLWCLDGRGAVVTGGAMGVGRTIADRLAAGGARVLVADIDHAAAVNPAAELAPAPRHSSERSDR